MIAELKPYAEQKDSGLAWLGQVPRHWEIKRLKHWVAINQRTLGEHTPPDFKFDYLDIGSVVTGRLATSPLHMRFADAPSRARRLLHDGDTVISTVRTYLKAVFTVGERPRPLVASTGFAVLTPRLDTEPHYLGYTAQSEAITNQVAAESVGVAYPGISETRLSNIVVTLPPFSEQAAIVRFLDWANGRLERAIRAKRKVIALLNEQKQAIIHRAVTRGLDPSVALKPSGIPWLGDIPEHWQLARACTMFRQVTRFNVEGDEPKMSMSRRYGLIRSSELSNRAAQSASSIKFSVCIPGDLVLNKYQAHNGLFGAAIERGLITSNYSVFAPIADLNTKFFSALFTSPPYRTEFRMRCQGVGDGMMPLYSQAFLKTPIIIPPTTEQNEIVAHVNDATKGISEAVTRIEREIALVQEYRIRLATDVVTGKLDVREAAARLPDEAPLGTVEDDADLDEDLDIADEETTG